MEKDSFTFKRSYHEAIRLLPKNTQREIYAAIMDYALYGTEPESLKPVSRSIFTLIREQMDTETKSGDTNSSISAKRSEAGRKGMGKRWNTERKGNTDDNKTITDTSEADNKTITNAENADNKVITNEYQADNKTITNGNFVIAKEEKPPITPKEENKENPPTPIGVGGQKKGGLSFDGDPLVEAITTWLDYKRERKESYKSEKSITAFVNRLRKLSRGDPDTARAIVEQSMANNWQGIFELKDSDTQRNGNADTGTHQRGTPTGYAERVGQLYEELERPLREKYGY